MTSELDRLQAALAGDYTLERELGRGGMATVYLATDVKHGRQVAVKVLLPELSTSIGADRFLREIKISARLAHPHIVPLHDSGEADGSLYYVMPFQEGESLRDRLERDGALPLDEVAKIVRDVAEALTFAHLQGVIHRDMKPENILLAGNSAVVADFGIARLMHDTGSHRLTSVGIAVGTPAYMSPEQAAGESEVSAAADIYSLGCVAFEMITGKAPFTGPSMQAVMARHAMAPVPSIHAMRAKISGDIDLVFERALSKTAEERFTTPLDFSDALTQALALDPSTGAARAWMRRHVTLTRAIIGVAAAALVIGGGVIVSRRRAAAAHIPMIAVLPFQNLGGAEDEYFADGVTDEMNSRLANISTLGVISRASSTRYKKSTLRLRDIALELGADYILTGTVRTDRAADGSGKVRVTPALVRISDYREIWSPSPYDANLVPGDLITLQATIAEKVASEMNVKLLAAERSGLAAQMTESREAYEYFLRGNAAATDYVSEPQTRSAVEMFERSVQIDPNFVQAWAKLGVSESNYYYFFDRSPARRAKAEEVVSRAVALQPAKPEVILAVGFLNYWVHSDFEGALREFEKIRRSQPNNSELLWAVAQTKRREGKWDESRVLFERASALNPRSEGYLVDLATTDLAMRRFDESGRYFDKALVLNPKSPVVHVQRALELLSSNGDVSAAQLALAEGMRQVGTRAILAMLVHPNFRNRIGSLGAVFGDSLTALTLNSGVLDTAAYFLSKGEWSRLLQKSALARAYFDSARSVLAPRAVQRPNDPAVHADLGMAYAGIGQHDQAIAEAQLAVRLLPLSKDAVGGLNHQFNLAMVYTMVGESDSAITTLDMLRRLPSAATEAVIRTDPRWAALHSNPRFSSLLQPIK